MWTEPIGEQVTLNIGVSRSIVVVIQRATLIYVREVPLRLRRIARLATLRAIDMLGKSHKPEARKGRESLLTAKPLRSPTEVGKQDRNSPAGVGVRVAGLGSGLYS